MKNVILTLALILFSTYANASNKALECLASVIWHESRGEPLIGQVAVGHVVLNRKNNDHYPDSICKVAFQKAQFTDLKYIRYDSKSMYVAKMVWNGLLKPPFWKATHYHTTDVNPKWAKWNKLQKLGKIGNHIFYRLKDMPLYDFKCNSCNNKFTVLQKIIDPKPACPTCGGIVEKLVSAPGSFEFKGNGFYETDYKKKG